MKKVILSVSLILCSALGMLAQDRSVIAPVNLAKFKFEKEVVDYGSVEPNSNGTGEFTFTNAGTGPLIISEAKSSCDCVTISLPKGAIAPGQTGTIMVEYDTSILGSFTKPIVLTSNAETPTKVLTVTGVVEVKPEADEAE